MGNKNIKKDSGLDLTKFMDLTEDQARAMIEKLRWPNGPTCPKCSGQNVVPVKGGRAGLYRCRTCPKRPQFTVTVGTIFEDTRIPLRKWVMAFHMMCSAKKGVSALQLKRNLGISYQSAWHLAHRIRYAMTQEPLAGLLQGVVEVDETYVGGKNQKGMQGRKVGPKKTAVVALVQRGGQIRNRVMVDVSTKNLREAVMDNVSRRAKLMTDQFRPYRSIGPEFFGGHEAVKHSAGEYVRGEAHVNTAESYFALLKRGIHGAFHHVSRKHLHRYCDEFAFRWNHRHTTDGERTIAAIMKVGGKRLMYRTPAER